MYLLVSWVWLHETKYSPTRINLRERAYNHDFLYNLFYMSVTRSLLVMPAISLLCLTISL